MAKLEHHSRATRCASSGSPARSRACSARRSTPTSLTKAERKNIVGDARLRHARLAELRAARSTTATAPSSGSPGRTARATIEKVFQEFFDARGLYTERIPFDGRSDYDEFTNVGIPAGGIFTGAEEHKTPFQQAQWGGVVADGLAGQFDPCYHLACD